MKNTITKRTKSKSPSPKPRWLVWLIRFAIFVAAWVISTVILVYQPSESFMGREFVIGEPSSRTFFSPISLSYVDRATTERHRRESAAAVPSVYAVDPVLGDAMIDRVDLFFEQLLKAEEPTTVPEDVPRPDEPIEIRESTLTYLKTNDVLDDVRKNIEVLLDRNLNLGVIGYDAKIELFQAGIANVTILNRQTQSERLVAVRDILTVREAYDSASKVLPSSVIKKRRLRTAILDIFSAVLVPNLILDEVETTARKETAYHAVPEVLVQIKKDELVVQRGVLVTAAVKERLDQVQQKMAKRHVLKRLVATGLMTFLAYMLLCIYLVNLERRKMRTFKMLILLHAVLTLTILLCKAVVLWPGASPYLMPTALAPLVLTMLLGGRVGLFSVFVMVVFSAPLADFDPAIIFATLLAGAFGTFIARRVRKRIHFLMVGAFIGAVFGITVFAVQIFREHSLRVAMEMGMQGATGGLLITAPLCFFLIVPLFEAIFGLVTDITLLELSDLNHPLLKRMIIEAPGTYHHSLVVSRLAESACEAIGANPLLARVGCYFHDIGKIARSQYFTENQFDGVNRHDDLYASESCCLIHDHVKAGIDLGKQFKLKEPILRFIPEHHGTCVVYYFYRKALDEAKPGEEILVDDYRYDGPKPQSRETAVALLADSTEAASRSVKEPTPENMRALVRKVINDKFIDGQLGECDLTLRDLHNIQESFVSNLVAINHTRISYPEAPRAVDRPDLFVEPHKSQKYHPNA